MRLQFNCCKEMYRTFTANIRLHNFTSTYVFHTFNDIDIHVNSNAVQKLFGQSLQTYGFTPSCWHTCCLRLALFVNLKALSKCSNTLCLRLKLSAHDWTTFDIHAYQPMRRQWCRRTCLLRSLRLTNFFRQSLQTSQVPSLCDTSRCFFSWINQTKHSEQWLHECRFVPVWIRTCCFRSWFVLNFFAQKGHQCKRLLLCIRSLCDCKVPARRKLLSHSEHLCGFSPVWNVMWLFRSPDSINALSHTWHLNGFSPVWILLCCTRWLDFTNRFLQTVHLNGFFPEWNRLWTSSALRLWQRMLHLLHMYLVVWIFLWAHRLFRDENFLPQWPQQYGGSPACLFHWAVELRLDVIRLSCAVDKFCFFLSGDPLQTFKFLLFKRLPVQNANKPHVKKKHKWRI